MYPELQKGYMCQTPQNARYLHLVRRELVPVCWPFIADEERGATLEATVCRMKYISAWKQRQANSNKTPAGGQRENERRKTATVRKQQNNNKQAIVLCFALTKDERITENVEIDAIPSTKAETYKAWRKETCIQLLNNMGKEREHRRKKRNNWLGNTHRQTKTCI